MSVGDAVECSDSNGLEIHHVGSCRLVTDGEAQGFLAMLKVLLCGENSHAYNISNPDSIISIKQMAEILAKSAGVQLRMELPTEEERKGFNPMSNSSLESTSLTGLGWHGCFDAEDGFGHTVKILKETYNL